MPKLESTLASLWLIVLRLVELHGIDPQRFLHELGIRPETLRDVHARLPSRLADVAFAKAAAQIPDPAFGLRAGECWHPSNLGTMGYAWLSSRTLHTGLKRLERFSCVLGNRATYRCVDEAAGIRFLFDHGRKDAKVGYPMADFTLSVLIDMCRTNFGSKLNAAALRLRRPQPDDPRAWLELFGCDVQFGAAEDSLLLDRETADMPLPSANIPLANTFDRILTEQLACFFDDDVVSRCKAHLLRQLTSGPPSAQETAKDLGMSQRTLQRRLGELGLTYQRLCDETRHELARRYLDDSRKSVTEVTFLLGFSEQSAFTRAFRRWSGMSPSAYRYGPAA
ncbi:AraC family transcriptional regulator [Accumulibacter sp.]|uniref:AraC family transcriptional regulator n=1 Tax=Accumulibacter sp. TaxID=2053492 RepID=UPI0026331143|nr:AraC family transcriptional regulator [Accumulibacter sp.]